MYLKNEEKGWRDPVGVKDGVFENKGRDWRDAVGVEDGMKEGAGGIE